MLPRLSMAIVTLYTSILWIEENITKDCYRRGRFNIICMLVFDWREKGGVEYLEGGGGGMVGKDQNGYITPF